MRFLHRVGFVVCAANATLCFGAPSSRPASLRHRKHPTSVVSPHVEQADHMVMVKHTHTLTLLHGDTVLGTYYAMTGRVQGPKQFAGDLRTPEGTYFVDERKTVSCCHLALHLSYPNEEDRARAAAAQEDPGINIEIHGLPRHPPPPFDPAHPVAIGTHGCIEVSNDDMDKIFKAVPLGTPITIEP